MSIVWQFNGEDRPDWPDWLEAKPFYLDQPHALPVEYLTISPKMVANRGDWVIWDSSQIHVGKP